MSQLPSIRLLTSVVGRDVRLLLASRATSIPLVVLPVVIFAGLPLLVGLVPAALNLPGGDEEQLLELLPAVLPTDTLAALPDDPEAQVATLLLVSLLAPMLLVVPMILATVAAASAIAGERERRTLELLLLSPITDRQLLLAKTLGAWLPAVVVSLLGAVVYQAIASGLLAGHGVRPFPNLLWTLLTVWVAPALAAVALLAVVVVSGRTRTVQDAIQLGGVLVLPLIGLIVAQATGVLLLAAVHAAVGGAVLWLIAAGLLHAGSRALSRDVLTTRL